MDEKRRLGPQDPLGWIRDTREQNTENPDVEREAHPVRTRREIIHKDKTVPMEVKVILDGQPVKQKITLEITVGKE
jgi:hypothetical protein